MWEFFIEFNVLDQKYLTMLEATLKPKFITAANKNSLSVAIQKQDLGKNKNYLLRAIAECVVLTYKTNYFEKHLNFDYLSEGLKSALIKCLVLFDFEEDFFYVLKKVELTRGLILDSFFNFKLKKLKVRWAKIKEIASSNTTFLESETFLDLLKFLMSTIKCKRKSIDVYFNGTDFVLCDEVNNIISFNENLNGGNKEVNLINNLITLAPQNINIHCVGLITDSTFKIIQYIFNKKINLLV